jgi:hypothetical protein
MLREVVAETVEDPSEIDAELTELLNVLRSSALGASLGGQGG